MSRLLLILCVAIMLSGCRTNDRDRLPATAVDNPDPIFGGSTKLRTSEEKQSAAVASRETAPGASTGQRNQSERIGPLPPQVSKNTDTKPAPGVAPGPANLALGVKPQPPENLQPIQPVSNVMPASSPEVVADYRNRMNRFGVVGLRTKALPNGSWEAVGHFPIENQPNQLRRIETSGVTEADALLAIVEQLEKP